MIRTNPWWLPGAVLIGFGVTLIIFPQLLALMIASFLVTVGALWLWSGWAARNNRTTVLNNFIVIDRDRF